MSKLTYLEDFIHIFSYFLFKAYLLQQFYLK